MLVDVVQMRATGMKLTPEELKEAKRWRGYLRLSGRTAYLTYHADNPEWVGDVVNPLEEARIDRLEGDTFVVKGKQRLERLRPEPRHPQAWLCTVVRNAVA